MHRRGLQSMIAHIKQDTGTQGAESFTEVNRNERLVLCHSYTKSKSTDKMTKGMLIKTPTENLEFAFHSPS